jgi:hypothetical protein
MVLESGGEGYVMKPQREGGGNNIYGADIVQALEEMTTKALDENDLKKKRLAFIFMENCQVMYKSKVTKGTASTVSEGIAAALSRRRLLLQSRALNGGRDISSSPAQEEVKYGETSTQEYNEPEENPEKNVEGKGTGDTKDTDEEGTGVDSDSVEGEGQLSLGWSMHGSTTAVALMWTLGAMVFTVFM